MPTSIPPIPAFLEIAIDPILLLLVGGHFLGDFALQSKWMVENKGHRPVALVHAVVVVAAHLIALLPFMGWSLAITCLVVGATHFVVDVAKATWSRDRPGPLWLFLTDQAIHLGVLAGAFLVLERYFQPIPAHTTPERIAVWSATVTLLSAFAFNWNGGSALVSGILASISPELESEEDDGDGVRGSGRLIGALERTIALVLILLGQWAAIVLLLAAKSIARFEELKKRRFAEYYLIGTLTSLLVAIFVGLVSMAVLQGIRV